jgi:hypothetical protein
MRPMVFAAVLLGGLVVGLLVGRWWIVFAPLAFGVWVAATTDVDEVPPWFLGLTYALAGVMGGLVGVFVRRRGVRSRQ